MTVRELAMNLIEHAEETPSHIDLDRAAEIISWLDPDSVLPDNLTPETFMEAFNDLIKECPNEDMKEENKMWYAVQTTCEDDWGTGSESLMKAIQMAREQVKEYPDTIIAVIENDTCIDEIRNFAEDAWKMLYAFYGNPDWQELNELIRFESGVQEPYCETEDDYLQARKEGFIKFDGKMTTVWED